jgi:hypothetical protein
MKLLTKEILEKLPALGTTAEKTAEDIPVIVKFFDPCSQWTWYATEYDSESKVFFGLVYGFEVELGYFSLAELESYQGNWGLGIERDMHFGKHTLKEVLDKRL